MLDSEELYNPFPGLRSFEPEEEHLFFGRETQIDELLASLRRTRFLTVVGTSGSGKSSLVRSGLIPSLFGGYMSSAGSAWRVAIFRPGDDPIGNLAETLNDPEVLGAEGAPPNVGRSLLETTLRRSSTGLADAMRQARLPSDENLFLVVDQFEELFRFKRSRRRDSSADESTAFIQLLLAAAAQEEQPIFVALTMRSDFLGNCTEFENLPEAINRGSYLIPRMTRDQRRSAITGPVAVGGAAISPRLVLQLLNDVGDDPDQLPILQHALMRTWDYWQSNHADGEPLDLRHYEAIGTMKEALSLHAEEAYSDLTSDALRLCAERVFKNLTEKGQDGRGIRRPTPIEDICAAADVTPDQIAEVVESFRQPGRSFLVPPAGVPLTNETILDISHESLMRKWKRLRGWVDDESAGAETYRRLAKAAARHQAGTAGLWRDPELQMAQTWAETHRPTLTWAQRYDPSFERAMTFLALSRQERDRETARREAMRKRQLQRTRIFAGVISLAAFLALLGFIWAFALKNEAEAARHEALAAQEEALAAQEEAVTAKEQAELEKLRAERERDNAKEQELRAQASQREADAQRAAAVDSARIARRERERAEQEEAEARAAKIRADTERERAVLARQEAEENRQAALRSASEASRLRKLELARSLAGQVSRVRQDAGAETGALIALGAYRLNQRSQGEEQKPEIYTALESALGWLDAGVDRTFDGFEDAVRTIAISSDGGLLAAGGDDGQVRTVRIGDPSADLEAFQRSSEGVRALAFSPDDALLAVGMLDGKIELWATAGDNARVALLEGHSQQVNSLAFTPDGEVLISGSADGTTRLWALARPDDVRVLEGAPETSVWAVALSPDGEHLAAGGTGGEIRRWRLSAGGVAPLEPLPTVGEVRSLAFSRDGAHLAAGDYTGLIQLWDLTDPATAPRYLSKHRSSVNSLSFSSDGTTLASAGSDGRVLLWAYADRTSVPISLLGHRSWVWAVAISPDGRTVYSGSADRELRRWAAYTSDLAQQICPNVNRNLTVKEWHDYLSGDIPYEELCPDLPTGEETASIE
jgi:hypothetical protein